MHATTTDTGAALRSRPKLLRDLSSPWHALSNLTPNWFASVMGTGIIANAAVGLPIQVPGVRTAAAAFWSVAVALLMVLTAATVAHWVRYPAFARRHHSDPVIGNFYGALAMAFLTVGIGAVTVGQDWIGRTAAVAMGTVLWGIGTVLGLVVAVALPVLMHRGGHYRADHAFAGWLMPVVSPMVTAAAGAVLMPYAPAGAPRSALLWLCYGCFGFTVIASAIVVPLVVRRLLRGPSWTATMVPTTWIVLGPLGQSITAANGLGATAHLAAPPDTAVTLQRWGVEYGWAVTVAVLMWTAVALVLTARTALATPEGLPYALTWWSFTFPVGTCATGFSAMYKATGAIGFAVLAIVFFLGLVAGWCIAARGTLTRALVSGALLRHPELTERNAQANTLA
ncbi:C4-dicarboxylate transporter/malic acid transport protein OS=Tsukamurella paurometabola (strain ATCC 8368 / DSM / CCUG 35730 / CIP 100753 / JCM 10117 /KCTC 9821 / NBRC 16120 / NCIMB 702349 / NCTC 13040) OX=521096 GN=Tpau_2094 PE=3 SV=1 [Tsukamurella paurometabola]|uniref:C4-dicarboxylate transporter/malic acid transport protein n=1 Tax=Tsukamurella paurometabola (strain ATCC 8368 / DSM 20162 / CCUG 35730 / CIP 100753 / JCM 10117 / KCTC 9821 / NBRC 16120 / NCIMB 702349 / NCTC 13040) TaxID=521096 RepID=D5UPF0_TSUPD|nr:TDT family transporter [Tsukamurella paurometabola]ADG78706.1 C4-dicarboxylate transporter/malic acid transport protein [Tsukamurella paurometabola DSM 20162]SUP32821.1 C4-dicarboxylate transporter/malic acid transport protein [Tsukamurella paurometabola]